MVVPCALLQWFLGCLLTVLFDCCMPSDGPGWLLVAFWRYCLIVECLWTCSFWSLLLGSCGSYCLTNFAAVLDFWLPLDLFFGVFYWGLAGAIA